MIERHAELGGLIWQVTSVPARERWLLPWLGWWLGVRQPIRQICPTNPAASTAAGIQRIFSPFAHRFLGCDPVR